MTHEIGFLYTLLDLLDVFFDTTSPRSPKNPGRAAEEAGRLEKKFRIAVPESEASEMRFIVQAKLVGGRNHGRRMGLAVRMLMYPASNCFPLPFWAFEHPGPIQRGCNVRGNVDIYAGQQQKIVFFESRCVQGKDRASVFRVRPLCYRYFRWSPLIDCLLVTVVTTCNYRIKTLKFLYYNYAQKIKNHWFLEVSYLTCGTSSVRTTFRSAARLLRFTWRNLKMKSLAR